MRALLLPPQLHDLLLTARFIEGRVDFLKRLLTITTTLLFAIGSGTVAAEKFPASWRKTMTNDPATNFPLSKYTVDLAEPLQTAERNYIVARLVGSLCSGAKIEKTKLKKYLAASGLGDVPLATRR